MFVLLIPIHFSYLNTDKIAEQLKCVFMKHFSLYEV